MHTPRHPRHFLFVALLLALLSPATQADDALGDITGCGVTMSCPAPSLPVNPNQCVNNELGATCGSDGGPATQASGNGQTGAGNPINILSGNKYQKETDMSALPGVLGLELTRYYNSQFALKNGVTPFGIGWRSTYDALIYVLPTNLQILQPDGSRIIFSRDPAQPSLCASNDPARGQVAIVSGRNGNEYVWHWPDGRRLFFNPRGRLIRIVAPSGEALHIQRAADQRIVQVTDPQRRVMTFSYQGQRLAHVDTPVGRFSYTYDDLPPAEGKSPAWRFVLTKVMLPTHYDPRQLAHPYSNRGTTASTLAREYLYEDARFSANLIGIAVVGAGSDGETGQQRIAAYAYDEAGRAVRSARGAFPEGDAAGSYGPEEVRLDFSAPGRVVVTDALGRLTTYLTALFGSERRITEARGPGCPSCPPTNVRYRHDRQGRLTATTFLDTTGKPLTSQQTAFDAASRPVRISRFDLRGSTPRRIDTVRYEYPPIPPTPALSRAAPDLYAPLSLPLRQPTRVSRPSVVPGQEHRFEITYNEAGQVTRIHETGYAPAPAGQPPVAIERTITATYSQVNGRSVLTEIDGPLPNGPTATPEDSDITRFEWDVQGHFITTHLAPGGLRNALTFDAESGLPVSVRNDAGHATHLTWNARQELTALRQRGPGGERVQQFRHDALGRMVEHGDGDDGEAAPYRPRLRQAFDAAGRLQWRADARGFLQTFAHDPAGRLIETGLRSARMAQVTRYGYTAQGQLAHVADNAGRSLHFGYTADGRLAGLIDALGRETRLNAALAGTASRAPAIATPTPQTLHDDFGRPVLTRSPDTGSTQREFDAANRLTAMTDAAGNHARYEYDPQGRILKQSVTDARGQTKITQWRYAGRQLIEVIHPTQRERFEYDAHGYRSARIVTLSSEQGEHIAITRYEHDDTGQLTAATLPDGSRLDYRRNGQGQVVALTRNPVRTPWLRWLGADQVIVRDLTRDLAGLASYTTGNGIQAQYQRSREGVLARIAYRHTQTRPTLAALPGISEAYAQTPARSICPPIPTP
jgi:YD repeat-containing protein